MYLSLSLSLSVFLLVRPCLLIKLIRCLKDLKCRHVAHQTWFPCQSGNLIIVSEWWQSHLLSRLLRFCLGSLSFTQKNEIFIFEAISHLHFKSVPYELGIILLMPFLGLLGHLAPPVKNGREVRDNINDYIFLHRFAHWGWWKLFVCLFMGGPALPVLAWHHRQCLLDMDNSKEKDEGVVGGSQLVGDNAVPADRRQIS